MVPVVCKAEHRGVHCSSCACKACTFCGAPPTSQPASALAAITGIFDHEATVIAVVEEAQFRGKRIAIHHCPSSAEIILRVALTSDQGVELDLAYGNAYALLEALAIEPDSVGDIPIDLLRARLSDPATPSRAALRGVGHYLPRLERLVASAQEREAARFAWA